MSKPLIFLGSNSNISLFSETAEEMGIPVFGIIDDQYYGNTQSIAEVPIVGSEKTFDFENNKNQYQFFVASSVIPKFEGSKIRRLEFINLCNRHQLPLATLRNKISQVSKSVIVHPGTYIGFCAAIGHGCELLPHSQIHTHALLAHDSILGINSVIERTALVSGNCVIKENAHIGFGSAISKLGGAVIGKNAVIHPRLTVLRDVEDNEIVSLAGDNTRKIYGKVVRQ